LNFDCLVCLAVWVVGVLETIGNLAFTPSPI
jgi:hypothetical protein